MENKNIPEIRKQIALAEIEMETYLEFEENAILRDIQSRLRKALKLLQPVRDAWSDR